MPQAVPAESGQTRKKSAIARLSPTRLKAFAVREELDISVVPDGRRQATLDSDFDLTPSIYTAGVATFFKGKLRHITVGGLKHELQEAVVVDLKESRQPWFSDVEAAKLPYGQRLVIRALLLDPEESKAFRIIACKVTGKAIIFSFPLPEGDAAGIADVPVWFMDPNWQEGRVRQQEKQASLKRRELGNDIKDFEEQKRAAAG